MSRLVVKSHRPWQFALAVVFLSVFFTVLTWLLLDYSHWSVIQDRIQTSKDRKLLWEVNQGLIEENKRLRNQVHMLEQTTDLDKRTSALLQDELASLQDEIHRLKGELEFYQGIMESTRNTEGLNIYGIHVTPLSADRSFLLRLVLTHVVKGDRVAQGKLEVSIEGRTGDETLRRYALRELSVNESPDMTFRFKNFKRFENNLSLPEGFEPQRVVVRIQPSEDEQAVISKVFEWPAVAG